MVDQQQMVVVVHQHKSEELYLESLRHFTQGVQKRLAIIIVEENIPAVVAAGNNMIQRPSNFIRHARAMTIDYQSGSNASTFNH